ncbi:WXG100 family type VII secretion target [Planomonospora sp. ID82291]|uniref:WXG100 family type VII secretion target n=1 Tax=Planomonospora sp. ID82291 TaxID=2738136 RepID=UPI0018C3ABB7|nr:WXG100 family type VII secretion target [Planomonospora sp. ID82291]MBG0815338.1 WXG100 family type VII secretion target [Planomonospora sp. ID82291]
MAYENDKQMYYAAVALAVIAAGVLRRPLAYSVVATLGLLVSDPGAMSTAAKEWDQADLDGLKREITALKERLKKDGKWEGEAFKAFDEAVMKFNEELGNAQNLRRGMSDALEQTALVYHVGAIIAMSVAVILQSLAALSIVFLANPGGKVAFEIALNGVLNTIDKALKSMVGKKRLTVGKVAAILYGVAVLHANMGKLFVGMKAMPEGTPDFSQAGLTYDPAAGLKKSELPNMNPNPGGLVFPGMPS